MDGGCWLQVYVEKSPGEGNREVDVYKNKDSKSSRGSLLLHLLLI